MRISQAYVSKSVMDFPFHQIYRLDDYRDNDSPCVFFGMYRYEDFRLMHDHHVRKIVFWTGQDMLDFNEWGSIEPDPLTHVTAHPKVFNRMEQLIEEKRIGFQICKLVKPSSFLVQQQPQTLGKKIYAYCPNSAPDYHGKKIIDELRCGGYEIIIGDGQFTQEQWRNGQADFHYKDCFMGLCLSEFAGGGTSIIEMGLRGMRVVTNVFDLPNCIPWNSIHDIRQAIEQEKKNIGRTIPSVARYTWEALDHKHDWLEI